MKHLLTLSSISALIPFIIGLYRFKELDSIHKRFLYFILFSFIYDLINSYVGQKTNNNIITLKLFLVLDWAFFAWFFSVSLKRPLWQIQWNLVPIACILLSYGLSVFNRQINQYIDWFELYFYLFFIVQSAYAVIRTFDEFEISIFRNSIFWIAFARLFYFMISIFIFVYPNFGFQLQEQAMVYMINNATNTFANISLNLIYSIALICLRKKK